MNVYLVLKKLSESSLGQLWAVILLMILPLFVILGFGVYALFYFDYAVLFALGLLAFTAIILLMFYISSHRTQTNDELSANITEDDIHQLNRAATDQGLVCPSPQWGERENQIWLEIQDKIQRRLEHKQQWQDLNTHGLSLIEFVANKFDKKAYDFTLPEGLGLLEEVSARYRSILDQYIPGIHRVTLAQVIRLHQTHYNYSSKAIKLSKQAVLIFRLFRLSNPVAAAVNEVRDKLIGRVTQEVLNKVQYNLKKAYLQEIAAVAIDLYSGQFEVSSSKLKPSLISQQDKDNQALELEPTRVVIVGQINAGKSTLVNALMRDIYADIDVLPTTDQMISYRYQLEGKCETEEGEGQAIKNELMLVELPGFTSEDKAQQQALKQMIQADIVIWVLKANQSARDLDKQLFDKFTSFFQQNTGKRRPVVIGVLNQIDKLPPIHTWQPPYIFNDLDVSQVEDELQRLKLNSIQEALNYNAALFPFDQLILLSIAPNKASMGIYELETTIEQVIDYAKLVQLNRQRHESKNAQLHWRSETGRLFKGSKKLIEKIY